MRTLLFVFHPNQRGPSTASPHQHTTTNGTSYSSSYLSIHRSFSNSPQGQLSTPHSSYYSPLTIPTRTYPSTSAHLPYLWTHFVSRRTATTQTNDNNNKNRKSPFRSEESSFYVSGHLDETLAEKSRDIAQKYLHKFFLKVHPDLFNDFPQERATNEEALQTVNALLDSVKLYEQRVILK